MSKELCQGMGENVTCSADISCYANWSYTYLSPERLPAGAVGDKPPKVDATETDMVEFALALHAARVFPDWTQETIIDRMRSFSGLPLKNWVQLGANIRQRNSLTFLDRLKNSLKAHNEEIDDDRRARRRPNIR